MDHISILGKTQTTFLYLKPRRFDQTVSISLQKPKFDQTFSTKVKRLQSSGMQLTQEEGSSNKTRKQSKINFNILSTIFGQFSTKRPTIFCQGKTFSQIIHLPKVVSTIIYNGTVLLDITYQIIHLAKVV